ncbi:predicted protein [Aspergillus terreus NIH2624]|uniref:Uncharacterized protein n=1 Tax=Aspergillus terreus (strain NIH 2624 / FGSC A1156) TaxID=341663 RepID=Q0CAW0_ASPTN|nr:uncharacterized protein ATEG_09174 [Aspergillus terreus NIH2624]EAU30311.1 predicted protein [Aspergillus terreus NIH2624]
MIPGRGSGNDSQARGNRQLDSGCTHGGRTTPHQECLAGFLCAVNSGQWQVETVLWIQPRSGGGDAQREDYPLFEGKRIRYLSHLGLVHQGIQLESPVGRIQCQQSAAVAVKMSWHCFYRRNLGQKTYAMTLLPFLKRVTSGPTSSTIPAASSPSTKGYLFGHPPSVL